MSVTPMLIAEYLTAAAEILRSHGETTKDRQLLWALNIAYTTILAERTVLLEPVRVCPSCGASFVKVTRKRFCSPRCQQRENMRKFRAKRLKEEGENQNGTLTDRPDHRRPADAG
jgi:predicted nucleic acid-binding Zn ribbon protein